MWLPGNVDGRLICTITWLTLSYCFCHFNDYTSSLFTAPTVGGGLFTHGNVSTSCIDSRSSGLLASMFFTSSNASSDTVLQSCGSYSIRSFTVLCSNSFASSQANGA